MIGLMGKKRSGKDTVADYLVERYGFVRVAVADPLKESLLELDPFVSLDFARLQRGQVELARLSELIDPDTTKSIRDRFEPVKDIPEVRRLLQHYGVTIRNIDEDFWVDAAMAKVIKIYAADPHIPGFVIPDVRFPNEALAISDNGWSNLWRVERVDLVSNDAHISETALDFWFEDATILNGGTILDLHREVDRHLEAFAAREGIEPFVKTRETA
jgi:hypothetical protein